MADKSTIALALIAALIGGGVVAGANALREPEVKLQPIGVMPVEREDEKPKQLQGVGIAVKPAPDSRVAELIARLDALEAKLDALPQSENAEVSKLLAELRALASGEQDASKYPSFAGLIDALAARRSAESFLDGSGSPRPELQAAIDAVLSDREAKRIADMQSVRREGREEYLKRAHTTLQTRMGEMLELSDAQATQIEGALRAYRDEIMRIEFDMEQMRSETKAEYFARMREAEAQARTLYQEAVRGALSRDQLTVYEEEARKLDPTAPGYGTPGK